VRRTPLFLKLSISVLGACLDLTGAGAQQCSVADPTGKPVDVRLAPSGQIVGVVPNQTLVRILERSSKNGWDWVYIELIATQIRLGWILKDSLSCDHELEHAQHTTKREEPIDGYAFEYHDEPSETVSSLDDCISSCQNKAGCSAYVYFRSKKICRLITRSDTALVPNSDAVSGYRAHPGN